MAIERQRPIEEEITESSVVVELPRDDDEEEIELDLPPVFEDNLAEILEEGQLNTISSDIVASFEADDLARKEWKKTLTEGIKLLGLKIEERSEPWAGACGIHHPLLMEAVVEFQSQAISALFPPEGPCKSKIVGKKDEDVLAQAVRVANYMNYLTTEVMAEYRDQTERMLFILALSGSGFKKTYRDGGKERSVSESVSPLDVVMPYSDANVIDAARVVHVMSKTKNWVNKQILTGFYRDVDIQDNTYTPSEEDKEIQEAIGQDTPNTFSKLSKDSGCRILEAHLSLDLEEADYTDPFAGEYAGKVAIPYIVTLEQSSGKVLGIRRNWDEEDESKAKKNYFTQYTYIPGFGSYGIGLVHLIGGLTKGATAGLRQLVDAGTLSNLPGGLKTRGMQILGDDEPVAPGEWRDVDVPSGSLRDNLYALPYGEPSGVLHGLVTGMVEEGRRFAAMADVKGADMNSEAPVGTTLALIERRAKVIAAIQARLHSAQKQEFIILKRLIQEEGEVEYPYEEEEGVTAVKDFDSRIDVLPTSNPNSATMAQRIMQHQAAMTLAAQSPELYDLKKLHRSMLKTLDIDNVDEILPSDEAVKPADPVTENMAMMNNKGVKADIHQDQDAHIAVHMNMTKDPLLVASLEKSPNAGAIQAAVMAHVTEHLAYKYRAEIEKEIGTQLPPMGEQLPPELESKLSLLIEQASQQLLEKSKQSKQEEENKEKAEDPIYQLEKQKQDDKRAKDEAAQDLADQKREDTYEKDMEALRLREKEIDLNDENRDLDRDSRELVAGAQVGVQAGKY